MPPPPRRTRLFTGNLGNGGEKESGLTVAQTNSYSPSNEVNLGNPQSHIFILISNEEYPVVRSLSPSLFLPCLLIN